MTTTLHLPTNKTTEKSFIEHALTSDDDAQGFDFPDGADLPRSDGNIPRSETFQRTHRRPA